jgi:hypothetical protein
MSLLLNILHFIARYGRVFILTGLIAGIFVPGVATTVRPYVGHVVAVLLFLGALRIDPSEVFGNLKGLRSIFLFILFFQIALPCLMAIGFVSAGISTPLAVALVLCFSASPISAMPSLTIMMGHRPGPALRLLFVSTALLPLTIFPAFTIMPAFGDPAEVASVAFRLFIVIFVASGAGLLIRRFMLPRLGDSGRQTVDGLSAIAMATIVSGLMTGFLDAAANNVLEIAIMLTAAFVSNFGMQIMAWYLFGISSIREALGNGRAAFALAAGNRNNSIFLAALPLAVTDPILLFIASYQLPMFLTPLVLGWMYGKPDETPEIEPVSPGGRADVS